MGIFIVTPGSSFAYLDFIVIIPKGFFVVPVLGCDIRQHPDMCAVIAAVFPFATPYGGGNDLVKFSISAYKKFFIRFLSRTYGSLVQAAVQSTKDSQPSDDQKS